MKLYKIKIYNKCLVLFFLFFAALFCLITTMPAFAEPKISFREAVNIALENNNELRASGNNLFANKQNIGIERSRLLPRLSFEEFFVATNTPADAFALRLNQKNTKLVTKTFEQLEHPKTAINFLTGIYLEQPVFDRKLNISLNIAKTGFSSQTFEYLRKQEEIVKKVALAYCDVDKDQKLVSAAQKNIEESQENLEAVQLKYNNKKEFYSAVLRASTALTNTKQFLVTAKRNLQVSKRVLALVLGKDESVDIIENGYKGSVFKDKCYYNTASIERNDIKSMELKYENAKNNIKLATADYLPTMGIIAMERFYSTDAPFGGQGDNYLAGVFVRWEMFDGLRRRDAKSKAQYKAMEACENLDGFKKDVSFQVFQAYTAAEEKKENLQLSEEALKTSKDGRNLIIKKYAQSSLDIVDLLNVQTSLNLARSNYINQENDYLDALINLSFASGTILKDLQL